MEYCLNKLKKLILEKALFFKGNFKLSSGFKSSYYFDFRKIILNSHGLDLVTDCLYYKLKNYNIKYIGGPALSAVPLISALLLKYNFNAFIIRKEKKLHGMQNIIEGDLKLNTKVLLIDDVISTGNTLKYCINVLKELNCKVLAIITILNRNEFKKVIDIKINSLFTTTDFFH